jgi:hypothetical protein
MWVSNENQRGDLRNRDLRNSKWLLKSTTPLTKHVCWKEDHEAGEPLESDASRTGAVDVSVAFVVRAAVVSTGHGTQAPSHVFIIVGNCVLGHSYDSRPFLGERGVATVVAESPAHHRQLGEVVRR